MIDGVVMPQKIAYHAQKEKGNQECYATSFFLTTFCHGINVAGFLKGLENSRIDYTDVVGSGVRDFANTLPIQCFVRIPQLVNQAITAQSSTSNTPSGVRVFEISRTLLQKNLLPSTKYTQEA